MGGIGPDAKAAVPALVEMLKDKDPGGGWLAAATLKKIQGGSERP